MGGVEPAGAQTVNNFWINEAYGAYGQCTSGNGMVCHMPDGSKVVSAGEYYAFIQRLTGAVSGGAGPQVYTEAPRPNAPVVKPAIKKAKKKVIKRRIVRRTKRVRIRRR